MKRILPREYRAHGKSGGSLESKRDPSLFEDDDCDVVRACLMSIGGNCLSNHSACQEKYWT